GGNDRSMVSNCTPLPRPAAAAGAGRRAAPKANQSAAATTTPRLTAMISLAGRAHSGTPRGRGSGPMVSSRPVAPGIRPSTAKPTDCGSVLGAHRPPTIPAIAEGGRREARPASQTNRPSPPQPSSDFGSRSYYDDCNCGNREDARVLDLRGCPYQPGWDPI